MKALCLTIVLLLTGSACATLQRADGSVNYAVILNDGRWGLTAACETEWVLPAACTLGFDTLTVADALVATNKPGLGPAIRKTLVDAEAPLPTDSRLRPYLDAIIVLLQA